MIILGGTTAQRLPIDLFPQIQVPVAFVGVIYKGAPPLDIEQSVVYPIEKAVSSASNVEHVESFAKQGIGAVQIWFNWGADINVGQMEVMQRVTQILNSLPPGILQPFIVKFDVSNIPVSLVTVSSDDLDERALYDLAANTIAPQIEQIANVAAATVEGGKIRQININLDPALLNARSLSILDVVNSVKAANLILPSGDIKAGNLDYNVFTNNQFRTVDPIQDVIVKVNPQGSPVRVRDVGTVTDSSDIQTNIVRTDGARGVLLRVNKQPIANTVAVVDALRKALPKLIGVPPSVKIRISFDQSIYIRQSISNLIEQALHGSLLAAAVILLFLRNFTSTVIISVAIPLSIMVTFIVLYFSGQTLNVFTLGGLALGIGRLVDDSIVELENIQRHLNTTTRRWEAILEAAREVGDAHSRLDDHHRRRVPPDLLRRRNCPLAPDSPDHHDRDLAVHLLFRLPHGDPGALLQIPQAGTGVAPLDAGVVRAPDGLSRERYESLDKGYEESLRWVLAHRWRFITGVLLLFAASLALVSKIGTEFLPVSDESQFRIVLRAPVGQRVEKTEQQVAEVEKVLRAQIPAEELETIVSSTGVLAQGRSSLFNPNTGPHTSSISVHLVTPDKRTRNQVQIMNDVRPKVVKLFPGVAMSFDPGGLIKRITSFGSQKSVDVEIYGYDLERAREVIRQVESMMHQIPGLADIEVSREENYPEVNVVVDREKAALLGISETDVATAVLYSLNGNGPTDPIIYTDPQNGNEYFISVWLAEEHRKNLTDIENIVLTTQAGEPVLLKNVASLKLNAGPVKIDRKYFQRVVHLTANPVDRDLGAIATDLEAGLAKIQLPTGFSIRLAGQIQQQRETFEGLLFATVLALILVYMVMAAQFKSLIDPFVIMFAVPMGFPGVILILFLTDTTLSTTSMMGVIMMLGIVVSNGVLLVRLYERAASARAGVTRRSGHRGADAAPTHSDDLPLPPFWGSSPWPSAGVPAAKPMPRWRARSLEDSAFDNPHPLLVPTIYVMLEERFPRHADKAPEDVDWMPAEPAGR